MILIMSNKKGSFIGKKLWWFFWKIWVSTRKILSLICFYHNTVHTSSNTLGYCKVIINVIRKLADAIINKKGFDYLNRNNLLSDKQCGICSSRSVTDILTLIGHRFSEAFDKRITWVITLDISKAFDIVGNSGFYKNSPVRKFMEEPSQLSIPSGKSPSIANHLKEMRSILALVKAISSILITLH